MGVGNMGRHMARRLAATGAEVVTFDPRPEAAADLHAVGVVSAATPAEVSKRARIVLLMVLNADHAESAVWGPDGIADGATSDTVLVVMSSLPPTYTRELGARAEGRFRIIDAPVTGGVEGAASGQLTIMASGDPHAVDEALPALEVLGSTVRVGDELGMGMVVKTVNQAMFFSAMLAAAEAVVVAAKAGVDPDILVEVAGRGSGGSWALVHRVPLAWRAGYRSGGSLAIALKDLRAFLDLADSLDVPTPGVSTVLAHVSAAAQTFPEAPDDPVIVRLVELSAGISLGAPTESSKPD
ncbi:NAD(P)-dependent oxidoreductase [Microbacterium sp. SLBN-154]|uniref:NAD(P)-dependent oxidoreductase n=1 Tax=Microbacterium sp. SLBN-154 TaxID=2768458 RepID=UPI001F2A1CCD|nr:NAD(P)-dependent oxidoreductase [Microbacterium sp. SLBN-154]